MVWRNKDENTEVLTGNEVADLLKQELRTTTLVAYASQLNSTSGTSISPQYVSDVANGRRKPGKTILKALGLQKEETYKRWR